MIALGEQEQIVRLVIAEARFSGDVASMAADPFEVGTKLETARHCAPLPRSSRVRRNQDYST